jgi:hypothetical protein
MTTTASRLARLRRQAEAAPSALAHIIGPLVVLVLLLVLATGCSLVPTHDDVLATWVPPASCAALHAEMDALADRVAQRALVNTAKEGLVGAAGGVAATGLLPPAGAFALVPVVIAGMREFNLDTGAASARLAYLATARDARGC